MEETKIVDSELCLGDLTVVSGIRLQRMPMRRDVDRGKAKTLHCDDLFRKDVRFLDT